MKMFNKRVFLVVLLTFMISGIELAAQVPDEVFQSLRSGNARVLASYFNQNIELVILDNDNVYSKAQAEQIVSNFFTRYPPERFEEKHTRGKEDAQYVIGNLITRQETFRVYFLLKKSGDRVIIHQLRIEKED